MEARSKDVEILVHINAPSRVTDDALYRQLAEAYLTFEAGRETALPPLRKQSEVTVVSQSNSFQSLSGSRAPCQGPVPASSSQEYATPAPMPLLLDSQDLSFQSALDNRESPRLGDATVGISLDFSTSLLDEEQPRTQSWIAPPSEIGDSYPMPDASLLRKSPTKVFAQYLRASTTGYIRNDPTARPQVSPDAATQANTQIEVPSSPPMQPIAIQDSPQEHLVLSTIPSSPPIPINGHRLAPFSPEGVGADDDILVPTSDAAIDLTHISGSAVINEPDTSDAGKDNLQPASDDLQDITHVSGSSIGGGPKDTTRDLVGAAAIKEVIQDDPLEVTHITSSSIPNLSGVVRVHDPGVHAIPQHVQDITHISSSSIGDSQGLPPLKDGEVQPLLSIGGGVPSPLTDGIGGYEQQSYSSPPAKRRKRSDASSPSPTTNADNTDLLPAGISDRPLDHVPPEAACLEIMPPSPSAGIHVLQADDLIPSQLAKLTVDLSSRYRPSPPTRDVDPLERGHWLLDCDAWPPAVRESTWIFLQQYLRSGLAGWGVWCRREDKPHRFLKAYCWGHVVKHAYLLLYLASERKLKGTTASWIDADGEVVIEVPSQAK